MRKFFLTVAVLFALFSLSAQEDLYQQYMNQYKNNTPAQPAQQPAAEPAKPAEPAQQPAAEPAKPAEEKKEEAAKPAEEKKEEAAPAEEKKEEEKKEEAPAETGEEAAAAAADEEENDKMTPAAVKPYFEVTVFGGGSTGITTFGGDIAPHNSYRMGIDNAVVDLKGGNRMFNGRLLFDLAKGFKTTKEWEINYDYDKELEGSRIETAADGDAPNALDILKDVSFSFKHPTVRKGGFGMDINLQVGLFGMPFGIESGYDHEITFANSAIKEDFLGGAFRDTGLSFGLDFIFARNMDLALTLFMFNGHNATMLDGEDLFGDPAFGIDLRYNYESRLHALAAVSLVVGSAYKAYDGVLAENAYLFDDETGDVLGYANNITLKQNKKNVLLAVGADIGYEINDNIDLGIKAEFAYSYRSLYNPTLESGVPLLNDGIYLAGSAYNTFGFFAMPYAKLFWFDVMARVSYFKAPFYETLIADRDNSTLGVDFALIYNFCDYAGVEFDYNYIRESFHGYNDDESTYKNVYNTHVFTLAVTGWFDFLWEGKADEAE